MRRQCFPRQGRYGIAAIVTETPASDRPLAAIILAAGQGTRMKSALHKVLHPIAAKPMLLHLLDSLETLAPARKVVVVGSAREQVEAAVADRSVAVAVQSPQLGTGHAVRQAETALAGFDGDILILFGDAPLVSAATMARLHAALTAEIAAVVLGFRPADPGAYGRIITADGVIAKMVEFKDASPSERAETLCNSGLMVVRAADLWPLLGRIGNANAAGEYYLPDIIGLLIADGRTARVIETAADEVAGVNSRGELAAMEARWQADRRAAAMADGVTLVDPGSVFFVHDTQVARDVTIEPFVVFGPGVTIDSGTVIRAHSHIEGASIGPGCEIGPFARLRPGTVLAAGVKIGNFVETKKAAFGPGAKANHLSYIGDADIGGRANIGAGTITCNYDGFFKYRTQIGEGAFIGSNTALVAPVTIGAGAIVGAGSTSTADVDADALALVRPPQTAKPGWAARFRAAALARKKA
ncbi:MAG: bifunctional UDP-N-acetylglucosamine diphosphorylase/glucosamine-1-phosphate N-acetyltransferase GlmU [Sandarakinorhabdus sp.]|nr:bifunctional UDP-N-acetylglucosamine diphosphorylase/glucosamine-1-phosphate N-acetyltransferase GlmU [Sandarakinorhabdus sp.]